MKIKVTRTVSGKGVSLKAGQEVDSLDLPKGLAASMLNAGFAVKVVSKKRNTKAKAKETTSGDGI